MATLKTPLTAEFLRFLGTIRSTMSPPARNQKKNLHPADRHIGIAAGSSRRIPPSNYSTEGKDFDSTGPKRTAVTGQPNWGPVPCLL